jgi:ATP sulfurylase
MKANTHVRGDVMAVLGNTVKALGEFMERKGYREVIEAYRIEKGLPVGFALTQEVKRELSARTQAIIDARVKQLSEGDM